MSFDRKGTSHKPKTDYWREYSVAKQNSFTLPLPDREVHQYDMRLVSLPCSIEHAKIPMKLEGNVIRSCSLQTKCLLSQVGANEKLMAVHGIDWTLCLIGKRFAGAKT